MCVNQNTFYFIVFSSMLLLIKCCEHEHHVSTIYLSINCCLLFSNSNFRIYIYVWFYFGCCCCGCCLVVRLRDNYYMCGMYFGFGLDCFVFLYLICELTKCSRPNLCPRVLADRRVLDPIYPYCLPITASTHIL